MIACTALTHNFAAEALVLAESFTQHNPGGRFVVCVIDDLGDRALEPGPYEVVTPADVGVPPEEVRRWATMYTPVGITGAIKPHLISALAGEGEPVVYIDADSCVYASLESLAELTARHGLLLSAQSLDPHPLVGTDSAEMHFAADGAINTGLLGATAAAQPFLSWWAQRTARHSIVDRERGLYNEQGWLTPAVTLFGHHLLRDRGCNVMGWNLHNRDVEWRGDEPWIDGVPLRHFHFNYSFRADHADVLTPFQRNPESDPAKLWPSLRDRPGAARICREYADRLLAADWQNARAQPHRFAAALGGAVVEPWMRERYRLALVAADAGERDEPPNPFRDGFEVFSAWAEAQPAPPRPGLEARLSQAEAEAERLRGALAGVTSSSSWRLTSPLRRAANAIRRRGA